MSYGELPIRYVRTFEAGGKSIRSDYYNPPPDAASYIIYKEGDLIKAKNGRTGQVKFSGSDAATVILEAINALSTAGGRILVKNGDYQLSQTILLQNVHNIVLSAESWKTRLITTGEESAIALGHKSNSDYACNNIVIEGFYIDCSSQSKATQGPEYFTEHEGCGIEVGQYCDNIVIRNNFIYNSGNDSIFTCRSRKVLVANNWIDSTRGYWASIHHHGYVDESSRHRLVIVGNVIQNSQTGAIRHGNVIANNLIRNCTTLDFPCVVGADLGTAIIGNYLYNVGRGIYAWGEPVSIVGNVLRGTGEEGSSGISVAYYSGAEGYTAIVGNSIMDFHYGLIMSEPIKNVIMKGNVIRNVGYAGIVGKPSNSIIEGNIIKNVTLYDGMMIGGSHNIIKNNLLDTVNRYGIQEYGDADYNVIEGNKFINVSSTVIVKSGANTIIRNNIGYVTENRGTATFSGDGTTTTFTIPHGLVSTPTTYYVEAASADAAGDKYVTADATNLTVTFTTAPPSGVDNVVLKWEAKV